MHYYVAGTGTNTLVLLHGWPQTSWQWWRVIPMFAEAGYRVVAPDYRGAGFSFRPRGDAGIPADPRAGGLPGGGYAKREMAEDIRLLLREQLGLIDPAFVLGHDIGAMLATAYALRYPDDTRALCFGEAPLPGTRVYERIKNTPGLFHFDFHGILALPEALIAGRERLYLQHFYDKLGYRPTAVDAEHFAQAYGQPGALSAGFDLYRAFERHAADTRAALEANGKLNMPCLGLHGQTSLFGEVTEEMAQEVAEDVTVEPVREAGHWIAEENPGALVEIVTRFDRTRFGADG